MKKAVFWRSVLLVILLLTSGAYSKISLEAKGIKLGVNNANVRGEVTPNVDIDTDARYGFTVGGFLSFSLGSNFLIQPEIYYSQKGYKHSGFVRDLYGNITTVDGSVTYKNEYIDLPILLKYQIPFESKIKSEVFLGPSISCFIQAKEEHSPILEQIPMCSSFLLFEPDHINEFEYGAVFGAGFNYNRLSLEARYYLSFAEHYDYSESGNVLYGWGIPDLKNSVFSVMVGYSF